IGVAAVGGVGQFVAGEAAAEAGVIAFAVIGPIARIVAEIDVDRSGFADGIAVVIGGDFAGFIGLAAVCRVRQLVAGEAAAEAGVIAFAVIGPIARIVAEIDAVDSDFAACIAAVIEGDFAGFIGVAAVCSVGQLVAGEAAAEAGVVALAVIGPIARIVTEID